MSVTFSKGKGRSADLMKGTSSRKRRHHEMEEVKEEELELKKDRQEFLK